MPFNKYNIDFKKLVIWLLPSVLRRRYMIAWLVALISPVIRMYNDVLAFRRLAIYRLAITPQVCYLEKALNDRYDIAQRRIRIVDAKEFEGIPLYRKVESKPLGLFRRSEGKGQVYYTKSETSKFGADFVIEVSVLIAFDLNELTAFVNSYKLASKKFKVKIV